MDAGTVYELCRQAGLSFRLDHGVLLVSPREKVTTPIGNLIMEHRDGLVSLVAHLRGREIWETLPPPGEVEEACAGGVALLTLTPVGWRLS